MLSILLPVSVRNRDLVQECIEQLEAHTDFPHEIIVVADGGVVDDWALVQAFLKGLSSPWRLLHNYPSEGPIVTTFDGLQQCSHAMTAIVDVSVRMEDDGWVGRVQHIMNRDPAFAIADTIVGTASKALQPTKRTHSSPPTPDCPLLIVKTRWAKHVLMPKFPGESIPQYLSKGACLGGLSSWSVPSIRYITVPKKDWCDAKNPGRWSGEAPASRDR